MNTFASPQSHSTQVNDIHFPDNISFPVTPIQLTPSGFTGILTGTQALYKVREYLHCCALCCATESADIAEWLLDHGADAMTPLEDHGTSLHFAALYRDFRFVRMLLRHGISVNSKDKDNRTPLHISSEVGRVETVRLLLQNGADADARDLGHRTPLHMALSWVSDKRRDS